MSLLNKIKSQIDSHEIISFDMFDTLVYRPYVKPTDLFLHLEKNENIKGFYDARISAEKNARKKHPDKEDITIDEIYEEISNEYKSLKTKEIELEKKVLKANPEMMEVYNYAISKNKQVIVISDMYLTKDFLEDVLVNVGYNKIEKVFVSSDVGFIKCRGNFYPYVLNKLNAHSDSILHIGDNYKNDVLSAKKSNISAIHYIKIIDKYFQKNKRANIFINKYNSLETSLFIMQLAINNHINPTKNYWEEIGYQYCGTVCYFYTKWLLEKIQEDNIKNVLFVARDGYSLKKIFDKIKDKSIASYYIYAPRQVAMICSIEQTIKENRAIVNSMNYLLNKYENKKNNFFENEDAISYYNKHKEKIKNYEKKERDIYKNYLQQFNLLNNKICVIDTATSFFTSQKFLQNFINNSIKGYYYIIWKKGKENIENLNTDVYIKEDSPKIFASWDFFEYLMTSPEPPIYGIENNNPVFKPNINKNELEREKNYITMSRKAIDFSDDFINSDILKNISLSPKEIITWINMLFEHYDKIDYKYLSKIIVGYDPAHNITKPLYSKWNSLEKNNTKNNGKTSNKFPLFYKKESITYTSWETSDEQIKTKYKLCGLTLIKTIKASWFFRIYFLGIKIYNFRIKKGIKFLNIFGFPIWKKKIKKNLPQNTVKIVNKNTNLQKDIFYLQLDLLKDCYNINFNKDLFAYCPKIYDNMNYVFPNIKIDSNTIYRPNCVFIWGNLYKEHLGKAVSIAYQHKIPVYIWENGFIRSAYVWSGDKKLARYSQGISFVVDRVPYFDATQQSNLEKMINDITLIISEEQKERARKCINKIVSTHLTKYNHQPIFSPNIGTQGKKKILVIDQAYGDMSITLGWGSDELFKQMLQTAIDENPDADIIIKTHPESMAGQRKGYYENIKSHDNIYTQTTPINPISLIKYVDKVYVCSTQFGFEALMCGKEVRVFGMPFYAGWGLTQDEQICERRTNKRTLEEIFYIAYIMYSYYVNPDKGCRCEIEEAMDYLLDLRKEYFDKYNIINELNF